jgi:5-methyltetrahydrofolate--homocysteine methyltransferase
MSKKNEIRRIIEVLLDFKGNKIKEYCENKLDQSMDPYDIFNELSLGLDEIGKGFEDQKFQRYFTSDLIVSGKNMKRAVEILKKFFKKTIKTRGSVVIGTVKGDVHDIGKMIFTITLESNGFKVTDLGVDVRKELFIEKVREENPNILGMSALLTSTTSYMGEVIDQLEKENLREKVKVIVGGKALTEDFAMKIGADAFGKDSIDGLRKCEKFIEAQK